MDQAREAALAVTEFFQGNPFGTHIGKMIEQATDDSLSTENWALNMDICDAINTLPDGPRDAVRAIRKRLQINMGKNNKVVLYTLTVLETAVKNCDFRFAQLIAQKEFCQDLVRLIGSKYDPPQVVQEKVLGLIQAWADAFRNQPDLKGVCEVYDELKSKGVDFPMTDMDAMVPIITPGRVIQHPTPPTPVSTPVTNRAPQTHITLDGNQLTKLRSELDIVNGNMKVLREMLAELHPGKEDPDDLKLLQDLNKTCRQMQRRLVVLLQRVANEEVTSELLMINDEMNNVLSKYDRYWQNRSGAGPGAGDKSAGASAGCDSLIDFESNSTNAAARSSSNNPPDELGVGLGTAAQQKGSRQPIPSSGPAVLPVNQPFTTAQSGAGENSAQPRQHSSQNKKEDIEQQMFAL